MEVKAANPFTLRKATADEIKTNTSWGAWLGQQIQAAYNTYRLWRAGGDLYAFYGDYIPQANPFTVIQTWTGFNWTLVSRPEMMVAMGVVQRNTPGGLFANDIVAKTLLTIGSKILDTPMDPDDAVTTCGPQNGAVYRELIALHTGGAMVRKNATEMDGMAEAVLKDFEGCSEIELTRVCQRFVTKVLNQYFLGLSDEKALAIADAIVATNGYIIDQALGKQDEKAFEPHSRALREGIEEALTKETPFIKAVRDKKGLTPMQQKAQVMLLLFTSFGGTISQMTGLLWALAKHPEYQQELLDDVALPTKDQTFMRKLLSEVYRWHPVAGSVERAVGSDPVMIIFNEGDQHFEQYVPARGIISHYAVWSGQACENPREFNPHRTDQIDIHNFGHGAHICTGKILADDMMKRMAEAFARLFKSSTNQDKIPLQFYFTVDPKGPVVVQIEPRENIL